MIDRRVRYLVAGGLSAAVFYVVFALGWYVSSQRVAYLVMAVLANAATAVIMYPVYRVVVFRARGHWLPGFLRFYLTCLWALAYALLGLPLLVEILHLPVLAALAVVIGSSPLLNYQIHRLWAFHPRSR